MWSGASHKSLAESCAGQCYDTKWCGCYEFERKGENKGYCKLYEKKNGADGKEACKIQKKSNKKTYAGQCWGKN